MQVRNGRTKDKDNEWETLGVPVALCLNKSSANETWNPDILPLYRSPFLAFACGSVADGTNLLALSRQNEINVDYAIMRMVIWIS